MANDWPGDGALPAGTVTFLFTEVDGQGDSFVAAFPTARQAVGAATATSAWSCTERTGSRPPPRGRTTVTDL